MIRKNIVIAGLGGLVLACLLVWFWPKPESQAPTPAPMAIKSPVPIPQPEIKAPPANPGALEPIEPGEGRVAFDKNAILGFAKALVMPFTLIGKVVDQHGEPVPNAMIEWSANNNPDPNKSGTRGQTTSDSNGFFIVKSHGLDVYAKASKQGYESFFSNVRGKIRGSDGSFRHGGKLGNTDLPMGTQENPSILVLRKMGKTVPLVHVVERTVKVSKNGSLVEVNLETGLAVGQGDLKVRCWTNDLAKNEQGQYDWKCVLTIPGGGLVERTDSFAFEAPIDGYLESIELGPPSERWASNASRQYFVKLADDHYARINFRMRTGGEHFFVIESFFNPTPGSRNLEYDPAKQATVP